MGAIYDDLEGHEGYALRRLPDGTLTSTWTAETSAFSSHVAACECRWTGGDHPATEEGYEDAVDEWEHRHARPLLVQTVPVEVRDKTREMKRALAELVDQRPIAGLKRQASWSPGQRHWSPEPELPDTARSPAKLATIPPAGSAGSAHDAVPYNRR